MYFKLPSQPSKPLLLEHQQSPSMLSKYCLWEIEENLKEEAKIVPEERKRETDYCMWEETGEGEDGSEDAEFEFTAKDGKFRKDVIFKCIVRSWKKHYAKEFQQFVGKSRQTFAKIKQDRNRLKKYANDYLTMRFGEEFSNEIELFLFLFIDKNSKFVSQSCDKDLRHDLFSMLYTFNTQKMFKLLERKGFAKMMIDYLQIQDISKKIAKSNKDPDLLTTIEIYIEQILNTCYLNVTSNE